MLKLLLVFFLWPLLKAQPVSNSTSVNEKGFDELAVVNSLVENAEEGGELDIGPVRN